MAIITTNLTPIEAIFPYSGVPELLQNRSAFARAEIQHTVRDGVVAATTAGNTALVRIIGSLPANYSYSLCDFFFAIQGAAGEVNTFSATLTLHINDDLSGTDRHWELYIPNESSLAESSTTLAMTRTFCLKCFPTQVMRAATGQQINYDLIIYDDTAEEEAYNANFYIRFQQFDINQVHDAALNSQAPVRSR